jgi:ligand-binding SRPBCC domain-containing protein
MAEFTLSRTQVIDRPLAEVFDFFADAGNLERITPPELNFNIITPQPIKIHNGTLIDYNLRLRGMPIKWRTRISRWNPPFDFIDEQLIGPYKQWIHRHIFTELPSGGTEIKDIVRYRLPLEPLGDVAHFLVRIELDRIFDFRQKAVQKILGQKIKAAAAKA